jgi:3-oxoacyl-[acyl-carrier-protein] synthase II
MNRDVAITGIGAVTPLGSGARPLYDRWAAGESGIVDGIGPCEDFTASEVLTRKEIRRSDRFTQMAVVACDEALQHASWDEPPYDPRRIGVVIGTGVGGIASARDVIQRSGGLTPLTVPLMMPNAPAGQIALHYGFLGPTFGTVSACAAGADAIGVAVRMIRSGEADAMITGGSEAPLTEWVLDAFKLMEATSRTGLCCPFDARRDGFIMAEGAGMLLLEDAEAARRRSAPILGYLAGYGASADAYHLVAPDPKGAGAARAIESALRDADVGAGDVAYVNAHGTSTPLNDASETRALKTALGSHASAIPISSTKSAVGHSLGAAGAVEAVATVIALQERVAPPTLNYEEPDGELDLDYVPDGPRALHAPTGSGNGDGTLVAISNSFGFGGHNSVLCLAGPD